MSDEYKLVKELVADYYQISETRILPTTNISPECLNVLKFKIVVKTKNTLFIPNTHKLTVLKMAKFIKK